MHTTAEKKKRAFTIWNVASTLVEEAAAVAMALFILPQYGINIPVWLLVVALLVWSAYSSLTTIRGRAVIGQMPVVGPEALIGAKCLATERLSPHGYVRVGSELWRARSVEGDMVGGMEGVIVGLRGLTLLVRPLSGAQCEGGKQSRE